MTRTRAAKKAAPNVQAADPKFGWWDNPESARLSTRAGWNRYCEAKAVSAPKMPSRADYDQWDELTRREFDRDRVTRHSEFVFVPHDQVRAISRRIEVAMAANRSTDGAGAGVAISGPAAVGKSTLIRLAAKHQQRLALVDDRLTKNPNLLPVVHVECPVSGAPKPLVAALADFVGAPWGRNIDKRSFESIQECLFASIDGCDVQLIVIDEIGRLRGDSHGRAAAQFIRHLSSTFPRTTILLAGTGLGEGGPFVGEDGEGNRARFAVMPLAPFEFGIRPDHQAWKGIVKRMEDNVLLFNHKAGDLTKHSDFLLARCQGKVGRLARLVREAALTAMKDESERITETLLVELDLDPGGMFSEPVAATKARVNRWAKGEMRKAS